MLVEGSVKSDPDSDLSFFSALSVRIGALRLHFGLFTGSKYLRIKLDIRLKRRCGAFQLRPDFIRVVNQTRIFFEIPSRFPLNLALLDSVLRDLKGRSLSVSSDRCGLYGRRQVIRHVYLTSAGMKRGPVPFFQCFPNHSAGIRDHDRPTPLFAPDALQAAHRIQRHK